MFSYIESRGGEHDKTVFFGPQYYIQKFLTKRVTVGMVTEAAEFFAGHGVPFNTKGWMRIATELEGRIPVRIRAIAEGSVVPVKNALMTIESTDPETFWIVSWLETSLMRAVWYPTNVATISWNIKRLIKAFLDETADDPEAEIAFKLHDFGARGVSSSESAGIGGAAHLVNFMGSDTVEGILFANRYYESKMAAFSIPASEHSTITSWGRENELEAYRNMLTQFAKPGAIVACVSDSYDLGKAVTDLWGTKLRQQVIDSGAILVVRPDSGKPERVVMQTLHQLELKFGSTLNSKGFKVLNNVRVIQGDGVNFDSIASILFQMREDKFSATNIAFGMGGALLQRHDRDTQKFAMKCSSVTVNGEERDVYKDPIDDHTKRSKAGRLDTVLNGYDYSTVRLEAGRTCYSNTAMNTVYENGEMTWRTNLDEVRARAKV